MTFDDLRSVDRRQLDSRRVGAVLIDIVLLTPIELVAMQNDRGAVILATALALVYFYLCDVLTGQTLGKSLLGLRTVTVDGELVSGRAAASRTVLRVVDHTLLGLIVMVATGGKRQRIGDLVAKTVVVRAGDVMPAPRALTPWRLLYPVVWLVPAVVVFFLSASAIWPGRTGRTRTPSAPRPTRSCARLGRPSTSARSSPSRSTSSTRCTCRPAGSRGTRRSSPRPRR